MRFLRCYGYNFNNKAGFVMRLKEVIILILAAAAFLTASGKEGKNGKIAVCYYMSSTRTFYPASEIQYKNLTHICHAFIWPDSTGNLVVNKDYLYPELIKEAHKNGVKVLVSLGGWGRDKGFGPTAADPASRANFISNLVKFCKANNYDGADIDWEYPKKEDSGNLVILAHDLRKAFDKAGIKYLTAALPSVDYRDGYDLESLKYYFDWFGIMTYDFHGSWTSHAGHNSPLYSSPGDSCGSIDRSVKYYLEKGIPKNKLCIGMAFYGREFEASPLYQFSKGLGASIYTASLAKIAEGWSYHWDAMAELPYIQSPDNKRFISFDDVNSIKYKSFYVLDNDLKGTIVWALSQDYDGISQPLLESLGRFLLRAPQKAPSIPRLVYPVINGDSLIATVKLKWMPAKGAEYYCCQVAEDSSFSKIIIDKKKLLFNNIKIDLPAHNYYWRAKAVNYKGESDWSKFGIINLQNKN